MNRFRGILFRWNKKLDNYLAMLHLALATIAFHASGLFGWALRVSLGLRADGTVDSETEYQDGLRNGLERAWYSNGTLAGEETYHESHPNGTIALEQVAEYGISGGKER